MRGRCYVESRQQALLVLEILYAEESCGGAGLGERLMGVPERRPLREGPLLPLRRNTF